MKTLAMIAAAVAALSATSIALPTPAAAGWCYEACGQQRPTTRTCVTEKVGNTYVTRCY